VTAATIAKATRYLLDGRLTVDAIDGDLVSATCQGDSGRWKLGYNPALNQWHCSCPALKLCSHVAALQTVSRGTPLGVRSNG
jgi:hypothetical protein